MQPRATTKHAMRILSGCLIAVLTATACTVESTIDIHTRSDELVVVVRELPTTYQADGIDKGRGGQGFEHDLLAMFAAHLGKSLRIVTQPSEADVRRLLRQRKAHLAAAWLSLPAVGGEAYWASTPIFESQAVLLQHVDARPVSRIEQLTDEPLVVRAGSPLADRLLVNGGELAGGAKVLARPDYSGVHLMRAVAERKVPRAAVELPQLDLAQPYIPDVQATLPIGEPRPIVWLAAAAFDPELQVRVDRFLDAIRKDGRLEAVRDRYFGHVRRLNRQDAIEFITRIRTVLPRYHEHFWKAEARTGIDWRLLAALAYQESHWNPLATSKTGVRGMMMLTGDTADRMGVTNRLDAAESIRAGAEYLALLRDSLPAQVAEPDRTWLAIAAYNVGMGHLYGARRLAMRRKLDPNQWHELRRVLPLLALPEHYETLPSGRARGGEAVIMVENIRAFYDILRRNAPPYEAFAGISAMPPM
jgi:membrane-bound lytic murein transglycosylase F